MTLRELIQRAVEIATQGMDSPVLRTAVEAGVEAVLPVVFEQVGKDLSGNERTRPLLRRTKSLTVMAGRTALADDVLTAYMVDSVLYDPADPTKRYSLLPWEDLVRSMLDSRLGHYALEGVNTLVVVEPDSLFDPGGGPDLELRLTIPCTLVIPSLDAQIDSPPELLDMLIQRLVQALRPGK